MANSNPWDNDPKVSDTPSVSTPSNSNPWDNDPQVSGSGIIDQLRHGVAHMVSGPSETAKMLSGPSGNTQAADHLANAIEPAGYTPPQFNWLDKDPSHWMPEAAKAIAGGAPEMAQHGAAGALGASIGGGLGLLGGPFAEVTVPAGAAIGGALGTAASVGMTNYGDKLKQVMEANGHTEPTLEDKARAAASVGVDALLLRAGLKGAGGTVAKAGESAAANALKQTGGEALKMGAANVGQTIADKSILTGQGATPDEVGNAATLGTIAGGSLRAGKLLRDVQASRIGESPAIGQVEGSTHPDDVVAAARVANRLKGINSLSSPSEGGAAINRSRGELGDETNSILQDPAFRAMVKAKGLVSDDQGNTTPVPNPVQPILDRVTGNISRQETPRGSDLEALQAHLGDTTQGQQAVDLLRQQAALQRLQASGAMTSSGKFIGGAKGGLINRFGEGSPMDVATGHGMGGYYLAHIMGGLPLDEALAGVRATRWLSQLGAGIGDKLAGTNNPAGVFAEKYGAAGGSAGGVSPQVSQPGALIPPQAPTLPQAHPNAALALPRPSGSEPAAPTLGESATGAPALGTPATFPDPAYPAAHPIPEAPATIAAQMQALGAGKRRAVLLAGGEKPEASGIPEGMQTTETPHGTIAYDPAQTNAVAIQKLVQSGRLNKLLDLGPVTKAEATAREQAGERPVAVTERTPEGLEVKAAAGTGGTAASQVAALERTKAHPDNTVQVETPENVLAQRLEALSGAGGAAKGDGPMAKVAHAHRAAHAGKESHGSGHGHSSSAGVEKVTAHNSFTGKSITRNASPKLGKEQYTSAFQGRVDTRAGIFKEAAKGHSAKTVEALKSLNHKLDSEVNSRHTAEHHIKEAVSSLKITPAAKKAMMAKLMEAKVTWKRKSPTPKA